MRRLLSLILYRQKPPHHNQLWCLNHSLHHNQLWRPNHFPHHNQLWRLNHSQHHNQFWRHNDFPHHNQLWRHSHSPHHNQLWRHNPFLRHNLSPRQNPNPRLFQRKHIQNRKPTAKYQRRHHQRKQLTVWRHLQLIHQLLENVFVRAQMMASIWQWLFYKVELKPEKNF